MVTDPTKQSMSLMPFTLPPDSLLASSWIYMLRYNIISVVRIHCSIPFSKDTTSTDDSVLYSY